MESSWTADPASRRHICLVRKAVFAGIKEARGTESGKSSLVQALGYQAIKSGFLVDYRSVFDVLRDFIQVEAFGGQGKVLARFLKPDLLIIDDMGMKESADGRERGATWARPVSPFHTISR
jgi:hypothetical protein